MPHTEAGGRVFVGFYFREMNRAFTMPQAGVIARLSAKSCQTCRRNEALVDELVATRRSYSREPIAITEVIPFRGAPQGQQYYQGSLHQQGASVVGADGREVRRDKKVSGPVNLVLVWTADGWRMLAMEHA